MLKARKKTVRVTTMKKEKFQQPVKPKWAFNIYFAVRQYPDFATVMVHKTQKDMMTHRRDRKSDTCEAFFKPTEIEETLQMAKDGSERRIVNNCYGEVHFHLGSLSVGIIAHELYHVVTNWAWEHSCIPGGNEGSYKFNGIVGIPSNEERCAELMGVLMGQTIFGMAHVMGKTFKKHLSNNECW